METALNWDEIVEDIGPRLYRYFRIRFSDAHADELTQETLLRLVRKVNQGKFDPNKGNLRMLSFGIAHYVALESYPGEEMDSIEEVHERSLPATDPDAVETALITFQQASQLRHALTKLSQIEQQVLSLSVEEELGLAEVSVILQIPLGTTKSHVSRAKMKLKAMMMEESKP